MKKPLLTLFGIVIFVVIGVLGKSNRNYLHTYATGDIVVGYVDSSHSGNLLRRWQSETGLIPMVTQVGMTSIGGMDPLDLMYSSRVIIKNTTWRMGGAGASYGETDALPWLNLGSSYGSGHDIYFLYSVFHDARHATGYLMHYNINNGDMQQIPDTADMANVIKFAQYPYVVTYNGATFSIINMKTQTSKPFGITGYNIDQPTIDSSDNTLWVRYFPDGSQDISGNINPAITDEQFVTLP